MFAGHIMQPQANKYYSWGYIFMQHLDGLPFEYYLAELPSSSCCYSLNIYHHNICGSWISSLIRNPTQVNPRLVSICSIREKWHLGLWILMLLKVSLDCDTWELCKLISETRILYFSSRMDARESLIAGSTRYTKILVTQYFTILKCIEERSSHW